MSIDLLRCVVLLIFSAVIQINSEWIAEGETYTVRFQRYTSINYITIDQYTNETDLLMSSGDTILSRVSIPDGTTTGLVEQPNGLRFRTVTTILQRNQQIMLLVDQYNHCVREFDTVSQNVTDYAGKCKMAGNQDGELLSAQFWQPFSMIKTATGSFYLSDSGNQKISFLNETHATYLTTVCRDPKGLLLDGEGSYLYIAVNNAIAVFSIHLQKVVKEITHHEIEMPYHLSWLPGNSTFLVADRGREKIVIFNKAGEFKSAICAGPNHLQHDQRWNKSITLVGNSTTCYLDEPVAATFMNNTLYIGQKENLTAIHLSTSDEPDTSPNIEEDPNFSPNVTICPLTTTRKPATRTPLTTQKPTTAQKPTATLKPATQTPASNRQPTTTRKLASTRKPITQKPTLSSTVSPQINTASNSNGVTSSTQKQAKPTMATQPPNLSSTIRGIGIVPTTEQTKPGWVTPVIVVVVVLVVMGFIVIGVIMLRKRKAGRLSGLSPLHWNDDGNLTLSYSRLTDEQE